MLSHTALALISETDYLAAELTSSIKHEFVTGYVFAMAGASKAHNTIALNMAIMLRTHVSGSPCKVYMSDMRVKIAAKQSYYYPDLVLTCQHDDESNYYLTKPCLIVEILSPSTATIDKREKLVAYQSLASLKEYLIVYQDDYLIEKYSCDTQENWFLDNYSQYDKIFLNCLGIYLSVETIYQAVFS